MQQKLCEQVHSKSQGQKGLPVTLFPLGKLKSLGVDSWQVVSVDQDPGRPCQFNMHLHEQLFKTLPCQHYSAGQAKHHWNLYAVEQELSS